MPFDRKAFKNDLRWVVLPFIVYAILLLVAVSVATFILHVVISFIPIFVFLVALVLVFAVGHALILRYWK